MEEVMQKRLANIERQLRLLRKEQHSQSKFMEAKAHELIDAQRKVERRQNYLSWYGIGIGVLGIGITVAYFPVSPASSISLIGIGLFIMVGSSLFNLLTGKSILTRLGVKLSQIRLKKLD